MRGAPNPRAGGRLWEALTRPRHDPVPPDYRWDERALGLVLTVGLFAGGWFLTQWLVHRRGVFHDLSTPFDDRVPLVVGAAWGYLLIYLVVATTILTLRSRAIYFAAMKGLAAQCALCFVIFLALPVRMAARPDQAVLLMDGPNALLLSFFYVLDRPLNLFPSLHLLLAVWCAFALMADRPAWRWPCLASIAITAISVLLVRQHYIADVAAGLAMAFAFRRFYLPAVPPLIGRPPVRPKENPPAGAPA